MRERYQASFLLVNVVTYAWFPLIAGLVFGAVSDAGNIDGGTPLFYLLVFASSSSPWRSTSS